MTDTAADTALIKAAAALQAPLSRLLGAEPLVVDPPRGFARVAYVADASFCTAGGRVHDGFLAAMLDECMAIAAVAQHDYQRAVPTLAMKVSYLRPADTGRLTAEAQVLRDDDLLVFLDGRLFDAAGSLLASANATARYVERAVV